MHTPQKDLNQPIRTARWLASTNHNAALMIIGINEVGLHRLVFGWVHEFLTAHVVIVTARTHCVVWYLNVKINMQQN